MNSEMRMCDLSHGKLRWDTDNNLFLARTRDQLVENAELKQCYRLGGGRETREVGGKQNIGHLVEKRLN